MCSSVSYDFTTEHADATTCSSNCFLIVVEHTPECFMTEMDAQERGCVCVKYLFQFEIKINGGSH